MDLQALIRKTGLDRVDSGNCFGVLEIEHIQQDVRSIQPGQLSLLLGLLLQPGAVEEVDVDIWLQLADVLLGLDGRQLVEDIGPPDSVDPLFGGVVDSGAGDVARSGVKRGAVDGRSHCSGDELGDVNWGEFDFCGC